VDYEHHQQQQLQYHHQQASPQATHVMEDSDRRHRMLMDRYQQEVGNYQAKLGREQHRVYELRKEREHLLQQLQQSNQQIAHQDQLIQQWQQSQDRVQHLEESNRQQAIVVEQLDGALEQARETHRQESAQLMEQQSHLIQELQRERHEHDAIKSTMRHVEQACQALMDPFDVRPGLGLVDQLKETQRQVKDLL
jgi:chromosome segregation ATPase